MMSHIVLAFVTSSDYAVQGDSGQVSRAVQAPIVASREPDATEAEVQRGTKQSNELSAVVNQFILRRTNALLSAHLPPKVPIAIITP